MHGDYLPFRGGDGLGEQQKGLVECLYHVQCFVPSLLHPLPLLHLGHARMGDSFWNWIYSTEYSNKKNHQVLSLIIRGTAVKVSGATRWEGFPPSPPQSLTCHMWQILLSRAVSPHQGSGCPERTCSDHLQYRRRKDSVLKYPSSPPML